MTEQKLLDISTWLALVLAAAFIYAGQLGFGYDENTDGRAALRLLFIPAGLCIAWFLVWWGVRFVNWFTDLPPR